MPVFVINGFLEAGKTQFITNTLQQDYFQADGTTVLILCEEGDTEYDKEILKMTSEESGIRESYFHLADEKAGNKLLYRIIHSLIPENGTPSLGSDLISSENLFRFQSSVIRKLAQEESCIIIGRCADYVLDGTENLVRIFVYAEIEERINKVREQG